MAVSFDVLSKLPYPGLRAFSESEKNVFFGRDRQLDELLRKIRTNRFLAVVGNAGSGKSSLIHASFVPKLKDGFNGQSGNRWRIATCRPSDNPLAYLAAALAQRNVLHPDEKMDPNYPSTIENVLRRGSLGIVEAYKTSSVSKDNLLIVIDQFEEIFAYAKHSQSAADDAATFVNLLLNASRQREYAIYVVLTMKTNFIGSCTDFRGLPEAINDGQFLVPRLKTEELKKAIIAPVKEVGATIDQDLVNKIILDLGEDFEDLPALQHLMMRVWDNWVEDCDPSMPISLGHYEAVGGIQKALSFHAEQAFQAMDTPEKKIIAERLFKAISEKGAADAKPLRKTVTIKQLMALTSAPFTTVTAVIHTFSRSGRQFIQAADLPDMEENNTISITYDSLLTRWERMVIWMDEEFESAELYQRISAAAATYLDGKGGLWNDPELSLALKWMDPQTYDPQNPHKLAPNLAWSKRYNDSYQDTIDFILKSEAAHSKKETAILEDADKKKKTRQLITYLSLGFAAVCLLLLLLAGVALESARRSALMADRKAKEARLAAYQAELAKQDAAGKEFLALINARRADQERLMAESATERAIMSAEIAQQRSLDARRSEARALVAFDSARAAMARAERERLKALEKERMANEQKNIADAERLKAIKTKGLSLAQSISVKSWKVEDPDVQSLLALEAHEINKSSEGKPNDAYVYEALYKAVDKMQNVKDNPDFNTLSIPPVGLDRLGSVRSIVVSNKQDEKDTKVYTTGSDGWLLKWNLTQFKSKEDRNKNGKPEEIAKNKSDKVSRTLDMSIDGKYLARGGDLEYIELFDVAKKDRVLTINAHRSRRVWDLEFMPDGNAIISAGDDGSIKYSNLKGQVTPIVEGLKNRVTNISLSGDGQHVAGVGNSSDVSIWNVRTGQEEFKLDNPYNKRNATAVAISPAGRFVAVGYQDGALLIWDIYDYIQKRNDYRPDRLLNHSAKINDIAFSDDGTSILVAGLDKRATLWKIWDRRYENFNNEKEFPFKDPKFQPIRLEDHSDWVLSVAFSHDGKKAITGCADGTVKMYEIEMSRYAEQICGMVRKNLSNRDWKKYIGTDDTEKDPSKQKLYIITADGKRSPLSTCGSDYPQDSDNK
jgi:WD40 repeat protein